MIIECFNEMKKRYEKGFAKFSWCFFKNEQCINLCDGNVGPLSPRMIATLGGKAYEENACGIGDTVRLMETRPLSREKRWRVVEIIEKAK